MASLKHQRSLFRFRRSETLNKKSNKKLDFDSCSDEDLPRTSSPEHEVRKNLIFDYTDDDFELSDPPTSPPFKGKICLVNSGLSPIEPRTPNSPSNHPPKLIGLNNFNESEQDSTFDQFSPCRTRSGRIYTSVEKKKGLHRTTPEESLNKSFKLNFTSSTSKLPMPVFIDLPRCSSRHASGASMGLPTPRFTRIQTSHLKPQEVRLDILQKSLFCDALETDFGDEEILNCEPTPLNPVKRPASRFQFSHKSSKDSLTSINLHSPPTDEVKAMKLFDKSPSPKHKPPLFYGDSLTIRRFPTNGTCFKGLFATSEIKSLGKERKRKQVANVNPFTPTSMMALIKNQSKMQSQMHLFGNIFGGDDSRKSSNSTELFPTKRLRVSEIDISRYEEEFVEVKEIASGSFGKVKVARHCLDGMLYAIKMTRNKVNYNTHEERVAMNEVFAQSSLMKHKHIVRYYNSWVEKGRVYIQNEYCEGGSLANLINEYRSKGMRFTEVELKRILLHVAKGLEYIHSKQLVHLDVKPENIFIALDDLTSTPQQLSVCSDNNVSEEMMTPGRSNGAPDSTKKTPSFRIIRGNSDSSGNESTDSGHASGCDKRKGSQKQTDGGVDERISYKLGDLGHVAPLYGNHVPEEGDCRYMAPELLTDDINREKLTKADIFSLGLTLYEAASLQEIPKNSFDDPMYERLKAGDLPFIEGFSKEFNQLLKSLVSTDENVRPSASKIISHPYLRSNSMSKSRAQLFKELRETKARLRLLEMELSFQIERTAAPDWIASFELRPVEESPNPKACEVKPENADSAKKSSKDPAVTKSKPESFLM